MAFPIKFMVNNWQLGNSITIIHIIIHIMDGSLQLDNLKLVRNKQDFISMDDFQHYILLKLEIYSLVLIMLAFFVCIYYQLWIGFLHFVMLSLNVSDSNQGTAQRNNIHMLNNNKHQSMYHQRINAAFHYSQYSLKDTIISRLRLRTNHYPTREHRF